MNSYFNNLQEKKNMELLTISELCEKLKIGKQTIYNMRGEGLPAVIHRPLRFDYEQVLNWLKSRERKNNK